MTGDGDRWIAVCDPSAPPGWAFRVQDARGGAHPFAAEGEVRAVLAGLLFDREVLDADLGLPPDARDGLRLIRAYQAWGEDFADRLRGAFAFVLWDGGEGRAIVGRDRIGLAPLFATDLPGGATAFSPDLDGLMGLEGADRRPNLLSLTENLFDFWYDAAETPWASARRLLPARRYTLDRAGLRHVRTWSPPPAADLHPSARSEDAVERFEEALRRAVARRSVPGRTGIFLSGGIDSISVAAVASRRAKEDRQAPPQAFSLLYADPEYQEEDVQRRVAADLGLPAQLLTMAQAIEGDSATDAMIAWNAQWPVPLVNLWLPAFIRLAQEGRRAGCDAILTGGGGDEWLGVSPYLSADLLRRGRLVQYARFLHRMQKSYDLPVLWNLKSLVWQFGAKQLLLDARNRGARALGVDIHGLRSWKAIPAWAAPDPALRQAIHDRIAEARRRDEAGRREAGSHYDWESRRALDHPIVLAELENKFFMGQAAGLRVLEPYWDSDLIELLYATHPDDLSRGGFAKGLVHRVVHRELPSLPSLKSKKIGLTMYYQSRIRREGRLAWDRGRDVPRLAALGAVDPAKLAAKVEEAFANPSGRGLWMVNFILAYETWLAARA